MTESSGEIPQPRTEELKKQIENEPRKTSMWQKAELAILLVKQSTESGEIEVSEADLFAKSLIDYPIIELRIGTDEHPIFPVKSIIQARPQMVNQLRDIANNQGIQFDENNKNITNKALNIIDSIEHSQHKIIDKYSPFQLNPQDGAEETFKEILNKTVAKQILTGETQTEEQQKFAQTFIDKYLPLVWYGSELKNWIDKNYSLGIPTQNTDNK